MKTKLIMLICLLAVSSCAITPPHPRVDFLAAEATFEAVEESLDVLIQANKINDDDIPRIANLMVTGATLLNKWRDSLLAEKPPTVVGAFLEILDELQKFERRAR